MGIMVLAGHLIDLMLLFVLISMPGRFVGMVYLCITLVVVPAHFCSVLCLQASRHILPPMHPPYFPIIMQYMDVPLHLPLTCSTAHTLPLFQLQYLDVPLRQPIPP